MKLKRQPPPPPDPRIAGLPAPSEPFRRRAWRDFQRVLDPLAPPRQLPTR